MKSGGWRFVELGAQTALSVSPRVGKRRRQRATEIPQAALRGEISREKFAKKTSAAQDAGLGWT